MIACMALIHDVLATPKIDSELPVVARVRVEQIEELHDVLRSRHEILINVDADRHVRLVVVDRVHRIAEHPVEGAATALEVSALVVDALRPVDGDLNVVEALFLDLRQNAVVEEVSIRNERLPDLDVVLPAQSDQTFGQVEDDAGLQERLPPNQVTLRFLIEAARRRIPSMSRR